MASQENSSQLRARELLRIINYWVIMNHDQLEAWQRDIRQNGQQWAISLLTNDRPTREQLMNLIGRGSFPWPPRELFFEERHRLANVYYLHSGRYGQWASSFRQKYLLTRNDNIRYMAWRAVRGLLGNDSLQADAPPDDDEHDDRAAPHSGDSIQRQILTNEVIRTINSHAQRQQRELMDTIFRNANDLQREVLEIIERGSHQKTGQKQKRKAVASSETPKCKSGSLKANVGRVGKKANVIEQIEQLEEQPMGSQRAQELREVRQALLRETEDWEGEEEEEEEDEEEEDAYSDESCEYWQDDNPKTAEKADAKSPPRKLMKISSGRTPQQSKDIGATFQKESTGPITEQHRYKPKPNTSSTSSSDSDDPTQRLPPHVLEKSRQRNIENMERLRKEDAARDVADKRQKANAISAKASQAAAVPQEQPAAPGPPPPIQTNGDCVLCHNPVKTTARGVNGYFCHREGCGPMHFQCMNQRNWHQWHYVGGVGMPADQKPEDRQHKAGAWYCPQHRN